MTDKHPPKMPAVLEVAMELSLTTDILNRVADKFGDNAAQDAAMSTSVGGIGPLLRERIIAQGQAGVEVVGVSLLYDTVWSQGWHAWNHLFISRVVVGDFLRSVLEDTGITLDLAMFDGTRVSVKVWRAPYGKSSVYFLDCPEITDVVYPCQEDAPPLTPNPVAWSENHRVRQGWLIGRGALALAKALNFKPDIIIQSETPTFFAQHRLIKDEFQKDPFFSKTFSVFNDHTPLEYAHPVWPRFMLELGKVDPALYGPFLRGQGDGANVDITQLLVANADGVFGVAAKHAQVMKAMPSLKAYADKIHYITNGVGKEIWQHPDFANAHKMTDETLLATKEQHKTALVNWLWKRAGLWPSWARGAKGKAVLLWTRRITSYKRLDMLHTIFNNAELRKRFLATDIILVVGGRVYQRDNVSEKMVYNLVELLNHNEELGNRIVFLHNFNVWEAPRLFHGADGALMLSDDGREASATGFMKSQMNGGLIIANPDGAVPEFVTFQEAEGAAAPNGFGVSYSDGQPNVDSFVKALEDFDRVYKNPARRAAHMRSALVVTSKVDVARTVADTLAFYSAMLAKH